MFFAFSGSPALFNALLERHGASVQLAGISRVHSSDTRPRFQHVTCASAHGGSQCGRLLPHVLGSRARALAGAARICSAPESWVGKVPWETEGCCIWCGAGRLARDAAGHKVLSHQILHTGHRGLEGASLCESRSRRSRKK